MTENRKPPQKGAKTTAGPDSSISLENLAGVRVRPAQFATMMGVSRQTVSEWKRKGWITVGPDGRLDPAKAAKQAYANMDPLRTKAHVMRDAVEDRAALEDEVAELRRQLEKTKVDRKEFMGALLPALRIEMAAQFIFNEYANTTHQAVRLAEVALCGLENVWAEATGSGPVCLPIPMGCDERGKGEEAYVDEFPPAVLAMFHQIEERAARLEAEFNGEARPQGGDGLPDEWGTLPDSLLSHGLPPLD